MDCCEPIIIKRVMDGKDGCCQPGGFQRRFVTKEEELEKLQEYRDQLKKELEGVEEHLKDSKTK
jgi:hypothetical protein